MASTMAPCDPPPMMGLAVAVIEMQLIARQPSIAGALNLCQSGVHGEMDPVKMTHMTGSPWWTAAQKYEGTRMIRDAVEESRGISSMFNCGDVFKNETSRRANIQPLGGRRC
jgi:hypothetical protein